MRIVNCEGELITNSDPDFKQIGSEKKNSKIIAVVPVKTLYVPALLFNKLLDQASVYALTREMGLFIVFSNIEH